MAEDKESPEGEKPPGISKDDIVFDSQNPNRARAVPREETVLERARANVPRASGTYPDIVEGSDSIRTGTNWGVLAVEGADTAETPRGSRSEGAGDSGEVHPNRNTGEVTTRDQLDDKGSLSTIDTDDSAGSPAGNS